MLYLCGACQQGHHERCERGHPAPKGVFGGSSCVCHCCGRSQKEMETEREAEFKKLFLNLDAVDNPKEKE